MTGKPELQRAVSEQVLESPAIQELHGDERQPILVTDVVNGANVGVVQSGGGLRLTLEAGQCLRVPGYFIWKDQRGLLQERRRLRQVDAHRWLVGVGHRLHPHVGVAPNGWVN